MKIDGKITDIIFEYGPNTFARVFVLHPGKKHPVEFTVYRVRDPLTGEERPPRWEDDLEKLPWTDYTVAM